MCPDAEAGRHVCAPEGTARPVSQGPRGQGKEPQGMGWGGRRRPDHADPRRSAGRFWKGSDWVSLAFAKGHRCRGANIVSDVPATRLLEWFRGEITIP